LEFSLGSQQTWIISPALDVIWEEGADKLRAEAGLIYKYRAAAHDWKKEA